MNSAIQLLNNWVPVSIVLMLHTWNLNSDTTDGYSGLNLQPLVSRCALGEYRIRIETPRLKTVPMVVGAMAISGDSLVLHCASLTAHNKTSSETQGQSVERGEKARRKFSSTGGRAPVYLLSPDHFHTVKRILAPDWAQKMLCIIVPNRRTASPEFFS